MLRSSPYYFPCPGLSKVVLKINLKENILYVRKCARPSMLQYSMVSLRKYGPSAQQHVRFAYMHNSEIEFLS
jgi:hypothetical protein